MKLETIIYDCLITPLQYAFQETVNNITQGYTIIGNTLIKYVFDPDSIDIKGCFMSEEEFCSLYELHKSQNVSKDEYSYTAIDLIKDYCSITPLQITNLIQQNVTTTAHLIQSYIIDGSNISVINNETNILGNNYIVKDGIFLLNETPVFFGFNDDKCSAENLLKFLWSYSISLISSKFKTKSGSDVDVPFHHDTITDRYMNFYLDHNSSTYDIQLGMSNILFALAGIGITASALVLYKVYNASRNHPHQNNSIAHNEIEWAAPTEIAGLTSDVLLEGDV